MVRTLLFSTLYPSSARPTHGIFVETRLRELLASGEVETKVVAPVPWFPSTNPRFGDWSKMAATPSFERRNGVDVLHPRYPLPPKFGTNVAPYALAWGARSTVAKLIRDGFDFDLIDAHYYYPDGVAAAMLARWFNKPFVVTARGTDLNLIAKYRRPRKLILETARHAAGSIGVCSALMDVLRAMGAPPDTLHVMRNGVDLERFRLLPTAQMRTELGLHGSPILLSVGHLVERKGHHIAIDALAELGSVHPRAKLVIVGDGQERNNLHAHAGARGVGDRVHFAGVLQNVELARWYSAADALILASSREGWANVLLESMACGTPVVATRIWGTPEVVQNSVVGRLVDQRDGKSIAAALNALLANPPSREAVRKYAEGFSWEATTRAQLEFFEAIRIGHTRRAG